MAHPIDAPRREAVEIGYWARTDCHRRGYATAAAATLTTAAFSYLPEIDEVHIRMDRAKVESAGVKVGLPARRFD